MATVSAVYGAGIYGTSEYGVVNVTAPASGVSATGAVQAVAINGFEIDISEVLNSAPATGSIGTVKPNVSELVSGVQATSAVNDTWSIRSVKTANATGVSATGTVNGTLNFVVTIGPITGVSATGQVNTFQEITTSEPVSGVSGTLSIGTVTATGVQFNFNAVKTLYARTRTVFVLPQESRVVYVAAPESRVVYVDQAA